MFAGPNGSGKSTVKDMLPASLISTYVNADEIEQALKTSGMLDLSVFDTAANTSEVAAFFLQHPLLQKGDMQSDIASISVNGKWLRIHRADINSYHASVVADFIRRKLLEAKTSFTFETVMSSRGKIDFLREAQAAGYRTYLYFVATESPEINLSRVANRVVDGGHGVPREKVISRYSRSLALLPAAIEASDRAYIFDNSGEEAVLLAEVTSGTHLVFHQEDMPEWFMQAYADDVISGQLLR